MPALKEAHLWQEALSDLITDPKELFEILELDNSLLNQANLAAKDFVLKVPRSYVARIEKGNINDPLLKQVLPLGVELVNTPGYSADPLQEKNANPVPGLLHKYRGRVLMTLTSACAIHCRFCFRRHFPYAENNPGRLGWEKIFAYINQDTSIHEVILSGGDPLTVSNKLLTSFTAQLEKIPHIKRLRFHTRIPVVLPQRIDSGFMHWLSALKLQVVIVNHVNHAQEITDEVKKILLILRDAGVSLLNQSVLLRGVNDNVQTLVNLSESLFAAGVLPYYLHVLDKVQGAAHFDMPLLQAQQLHSELTTHLPGYLVPKLAREDAGKLAKTILNIHEHND